MKQTTRVLTALALVLGGVGHARAEFTTPSGLQPGDQFRVVFVTDGTIAATSTDISTYDNFVSTEAANAGLSTYNGSPVTWEALVSVDEGNGNIVNAISRLPADTVPIYLPDGTEVAQSGTALWSTNLLSPIIEDASGTTHYDYVWTGTYDNGEALLPLGNSAYPQVTAGVSYSDRGAWIYLGPVTYPTYPLSLYAFSSILTVPSAQTVPEPSALTLLGLGAAGLGVYGWRRRKLATA